ncbi:MAG: CpXC domain-containing protein [Anaerolineae bacterium]
MSQMMARVTCPSCNQLFVAPLERILDVEVDPAAKSRLLSGQVNMVICPHCGTAGALDLPFIYHDPEKELALIYAPMEAGRNDVERQKLIGSLSQTLLNQLPPEQKRSYLLNPREFLTLDGLIKRVLEAEGITDEMMEAQQAKAELIGQLLEAASDEERRELIEEHTEELDEEFFQIFQVNLSQIEASGSEELIERFSALEELLLTETEIGRQLAQRADAFRQLQEEPTQKRLVDLLVEAEDRATRAALVTFGQPLIDYAFFQQFTRRIDDAEDEAERERLKALRKEVMDIREELREQAQRVVDEKRALVDALLNSDDVELLARRRMADMDELFFNVLVAQLERARQVGDEQTAAGLEEILELSRSLMEEAIPPEVVLLSEISEAEGEDEVREILDENEELITPNLVRMLEGIQAQLHERGEATAAERIGTALSIARARVPDDAAQDLLKKGASERQSPSGLVMA